MKKYYLQDIFVPVGFPEKTYIDRKELKRQVDLAKLNKGKHMVIYGPSKSGKSNLWRRHFQPSEVIKVPINYNKNINDIYSEILNDLEAIYISERGADQSLKKSFNAEVKATLKMVIEGKINGGNESEKRTSKKEVAVAQQIIAPNLVIKYLKPTGRRVALEDFHYANEELRNCLAQDLKAFSDENCQFILISVQHKNTDLIMYNQDLQQRISSIQVGLFNDEEIHTIITTGGTLLNVELSDDVCKRIIRESMRSAALAQELCQRICFENGILQTGKRITLNNVKMVEDACINIALDHRPFYEDIVKNVAAGGRTDGSTEKYKWFLKVVQLEDIPDGGLLNTEIYQKIRELGHTSIDQGSVTQGLKYLPTLLEKRKLPMVFDYDDESKRFFLLDKYMKFVFKWMPDLIDDLFAGE